MRGGHELMERAFAGLTPRGVEPRLRYRCCHGTVSDAVRGAAPEFPEVFIALVKAGAALPRNHADWLEELATKQREPAGILAFDVGLEREHAERVDALLVRVAHTRAFLDHHSLHLALVAPPASEAVAPFPGWWQTRAG